MDGVELPQGYSHFEEVVYLLPFSSQKFLIKQIDLLAFTTNVFLGNLGILQKQPPEVFYKKAVFKKFRNIHRKVAGLPLY